MLDSDPNVPGSKTRAATVVTRKNTQQLLSVPLIDDSTTNHINFNFCYIRQMAAPQNTYSKQLSHSKSISYNKTCTCLCTNTGGSNVRLCTQEHYRFTGIQGGLLL
ncbi:hypothetical protein AVEN_170126-1 [Araneus ventricosus]|uniref:Uncharacterized protein n=1 Tax=Araneus ventricosus TaxID=182803 RepID=A0A4Y2LHW5_ARAVE|nr:hypothetical protein AVEN_170126-1 [Araneus ventricosus]